MQDAEKEKNCYGWYQKLGGIINEKDYQSAITRAKNTITLAIALTKQSELVAKIAGIQLLNAKDTIDRRTILYGILRADTKPKEAKYHHSQMSDQRLFAEVLRMLGDTDALSKLIDAYHKIETYCPICLKVVASGEECR